MKSGQPNVRRWLVRPPDPPLARQAHPPHQVERAADPVVKLEGTCSVTKKLERSGCRETAAAAITRTSLQTATRSGRMTSPISNGRSVAY
jgi:hypothetical protein